MEKIRRRLFEIIEVAEGNDKASNIYDIFMMVTIIISLVPLCTKSTAMWTKVIDYVTVGIFVIDYLLRLFTADLKLPAKGIKAFVKYPFTPLAIIDLISILPSFTAMSEGLKIFKTFRLLRTLKVFKSVKALKAFKTLKIFRYSKSIDIIINVIKKQKEALITVLGLAFGYIFVSALIIFNVEPDSFENFFEAIYWACVSLTTVGYGDVYPISTAGRIVTMLSSIAGIAVVALPAGIITAGYMDALSEVKKEDNSEDKENKTE